MIKAVLVLLEQTQDVPAVLLKLDSLAFESLVEHEALFSDWFAATVDFLECQLNDAGLGSR